MTLDEAKEAFDSSPSDKVAGEYLATVSQYWRDGMIILNEFHSVVDRVAEWLIDA